MNYIRQELAFGSVVNPKGDIVPVWRTFLQARVDQEALGEWGRNPLDPALPVLLSEPPKRTSLLKSLAGVLP